MKITYASVTAGRRPFLEKLAAVAAAGFAGISVSIFDYRAARSEGHSDADIVAAARGCGVEIASVGGATRWLNGTADEDEVLTMALAERFGSRMINCSPSNGVYSGPESAAAAFAAVCDRAALRGFSCRLEFIPWTGVRDLATGLDVVRRAGRPNGGLLIDNWHLQRSGGTLAELRAIPPECIFGVQLSDDTLEWTQQDPKTRIPQRLLPGEGELDVAGFVAVLEQIGASAGYEAEPINRRWDEMPASVGLPLVYDATARVVATAKQTG